MRWLRRVLVLLLFVLACAPERSAARVQGFDALVPPGAAAMLVAKVEADDLLHLHPDLRDVAVRFRLAGQEIGRAVSGRDGLASCTWTPPAAGVHEVEVVADPGERGRTILRVFVRDRDRRVLVVDLDGTVCAGSGLDVIRKPPAEIPVIEGAPDALTRLATRFDLLYLTARDDSLITRSREWLDLNGFPRAPILVRDLGLHTLSAEKYKKRRLAELAQTWRLAAGVGDREEDLAAYRSVGMRTFLVPDVSWEEIGAALSAPRAPAGAPRDPGGR